MKVRIKPLLMSLCLAGCIASSGVSVAAPDNDNQSLERKVNALQNEISHLKSEMRHHKRVSHVVVSQPQVQGPLVYVPHDTADQLVGPDNLPMSGIRYFPIDLDVPGQAFVSTGPYLAIPLSFSGSDLIINTPSVNQDVALMKLRKNINERLMKMGICPTQKTHLMLSGSVEGQAAARLHGGRRSTDIDLASANLDAYILSPSNWVQGLIAFSYENDVGASTGTTSSLYRVANSRVFVNKAFVTVGDLTCSPFYLTIGQMYVPFGTYSSNMISSPLTKPVGRIKARAVLLGYSPLNPNTFYGSIYAFKGDSFTGNGNTQINNGGVNVGYRFKCNTVSGDFGGGVVRNIADAGGMQETDNRPFWDGFGSNFSNCGPSGTSPCGNESLVHTVPGLDVRGLLSITDKLDFLAEYVTASRRFSPADMTYNGYGARPSALNAEVAYTFDICDKPSSVAVGYGMSQNALALGIPARRYIGVFNTSIWRNTMQSIEFRHDKNYGSTTTASGSGIAAANGNGQSSSTITAQFSLYF